MTQQHNNLQHKLQAIDTHKKQIDTYRPFPPAVLSQLKEYYRISFTYSSNAVEGNSLTESETKIVLEDGITIGGKPLKDHYEAVGHSNAYDFLYTKINENHITEQDILTLHRLFYQKIDQQNAGVYRKVGIIVTVSDFTFPPPKQVPSQMEQLITTSAKQRKKQHPVLYASWLHLKIVQIHPFVDGNGRTARLVMNLALMQAGYNIAIIPPIRRLDYLNALKQADTGNQEAFHTFIAEIILEAQHDNIRLLKQING